MTDWEAAMHQKGLPDDDLWKRIDPLLKPKLIHPRNRLGANRR